MTIGQCAEPLLEVAMRKFFCGYEPDSFLSRTPPAVSQIPSFFRHLPILWIVTRYGINLCCLSRLEINVS
jgi:hypothetical protein